MLKVGEVAKKTNISVRTLHHYDEIGLLKPSSHSESGYRLYSLDDLLRLQQILSLQFIGLSLENIKSLLDEDHMSLAQALNMQLEFMEQQIVKQKYLSGMLKHLLLANEEQQDISLDTICKTVEATKMFDKYYTEDQKARLAKREYAITEEKQKEYHLAWLTLFEGLDKLQKAGVSADDERTKPFAKKSRELLAAFTNGEKDIEASVNEMYEKEGGANMLQAHGMPVSDELYAYYEKTVHAHCK